MQDHTIKKEIIDILSSNSTQEEKVKQFEILIEQVKIAYYVKSANDISREKAQRRREREKNVLNQIKSGKVIILNS